MKTSIMSCVKFTAFKRALPAMAALAVLFSWLPRIALAQSGSVGEVDKAMLLWQPDIVYETTLSATFEANGVSITGTFDGSKKISGSSRNALKYGSLVKYSTRLLTGNNDGGKAYRYYDKAQMWRIPDDSKISITGFSAIDALGGLFKDLPGEKTEYEVVERRAPDPFWDQVSGYSLVIRPKNTSAVDVVDELKPVFEIIPALINRAYILNWNSATQIGKAKLNISFSDNNQAQDTKMQVPEAVSDFIKRESSLLYTAALGNQSRKTGDVWIMDGKVLGALIYPTLKNAFRGQIVVQAERITTNTEALKRQNISTGSAPSNPGIDKFASEPINGLLISFLPDGVINGNRFVSNLMYATKTADGNTREISVDFSNPKKVHGAMIIDTDYQMIRHAYIEVKDGNFQGSIPAFGKLTVNADVRGGISLSMDYDCIRVK